MGLSVVAHTCNSNTYEAEAGGLPQVRVQPKLHGESRVCLKKPQQRGTGTKP